MPLHIFAILLTVVILAAGLTAWFLFASVDSVFIPGVIVALLVASGLLRLFQGAGK